MIHKVIAGGQDVFCQACGRSWALDEEPPLECLPVSRPAPVDLQAYLVGVMNPGTNPCLVFAFSKEDAEWTLSKVLGIHQGDMISVAAPKLNWLCRVRTSCPSFSPSDLETAFSTYRELINETWPGAGCVANPFKMAPRKK